MTLATFCFRGEGGWPEVHILFELLVAARSRLENMEIEKDGWDGLEYDEFSKNASRAWEAKQTKLSMEHGRHTVKSSRKKSMSTKSNKS